MPGFFKFSSSIDDQRYRVLNAIKPPSSDMDIRKMLKRSRESSLNKQTKFSSKGSVRKELPATGWLTEQEVSAIIGCSLSLLRQNRHKHKGIPYTKMGRSVRYAAEDVKLFMDRHRVQPE